jgi:hypothetical protein
MKLRAWILAATIAAATALLTTPNAQACVINPDGECMRPVLTGQPLHGHAKHHPTTPTHRPKRHKPPLEP